jgi:hypothetical protein
LHIFSIALATFISTPETPADSSRGQTFALEASMLFPTNDRFGGAKDPGFGAALDLGYEGSLAGGLLQLGFHYGPRGSDGHYLHVALNGGILFMPPLPGIVTPVFGGGVGVRFLQVQGVKTSQDVGGVIRLHAEQRPSESDFGFGANARAGIILFRGGPVELFLVTDYSFMFIDGTPQALITSIGVSA